MLFLLFALSLVHISESVSAITRPRCVVTAPYLLSLPITKVAVKDLVIEAQAWYQHELTTFAENANLLPTSQRRAALDRLMSVFCTGDNFRGYIGITPDGQLFTNRSYVASLYDSFPSGTDMTFNVVVYNQIVTITSQAPVLDHVYANATAFLYLTTKSATFNLSSFFGHYQNEWRIDSEGYPCISRFHDQVTKWFLLESTQVLSIPWNL